MGNQGLWHIRDHLFGFLDHETLEICRQVSDFWDESLGRLSLLKFLTEFRDRKAKIIVKIEDGISDHECEVEAKDKKVRTLIPGWKKAVKKFGNSASVEDLHEVKHSLLKLMDDKGRCLPDPVQKAARCGYLKLMEFLLCTSFDMNSRDYHGFTALHRAANNRHPEVVRLIIESSTTHDIDLNAQDEHGCTALHLACQHLEGIDVVQLMINLSSKYAIDLNAKSRGGYGYTAYQSASYHGNFEAARLLSDAIGDFNTRNHSGQTIPLSLRIKFPK